jgi:hypothetical protein
VLANPLKNQPPHSLQPTQSTCRNNGPNAHVLVHNDDTGTQRSLTTSASGAYAAPSIPVGTYTVSVDAPGVITATANTSRQIQLGLKLLF